MIFEKAYKELKEGKRIRRKSWEPLMHMVILEDQIKTFKGEYSNFHAQGNVILSKGWRVIEEDGTTGKEIDFVAVLEELKSKKRITHDSWKSYTFLFVDGDKLAVCKPIEYDFMPTYKCFCSNDWEVMK